MNWSDIYKAEFSKFKFLDCFFRYQKSSERTCKFYFCSASYILKILININIFCIYCEPLPMGKFGHFVIIHSCLWTSKVFSHVCCDIISLYCNKVLKNHLFLLIPVIDNKTDKKCLLINTCIFLEKMLDIFL